MTDALIDSQPPGIDAVQFAAGARIGPYEIIREIGRGGMGAVYAARDTKLGRRVAIKFLSSTHDPELTARFVVEARATARCSHENIIVIHDVGEHAGSPYMVLEYLQGAPLSTLMRDGRRLAPAQAVELIAPVVRALAVAHAHDIVHRDLKPDNIFMTDAGAIKVLDFGIAKLREDAPAPVAHAVAHARPTMVHAAVSPRQLTLRGAVMGTLPYMSPEQWAGAGEVDHQTDLWAVGIILFEMLAGHHPLAPRAGWDLMVTGVMSEPMPSLRSAAPGVPDELADLVDRCLRKPRDQRVASARDLIDALEPLLPGRHVRRLRSDESPYAGLRSFQEADAHRFFGRARDVAAAVSRLREVPLLGIVGPSGVGKSSFVRAGLLPALKASGEAWSALVIRPGRHPLSALAAALAPLIHSQSPATPSVLAADAAAHDAIIDRLRVEPGYLAAVLRARARSRDQHLLVFVDQFEELYTQVADPRERAAFTACLAGVCDDPATPLRLVLSLRSDFLDHVAEAPALLAELTHGLFFLTPPDRDGLRDALLQPAQMAGYQFEVPAMVEAMLDHLEHTPGALPLLQFAASQLWEMRERDTRLLTAASYRQIGGIAGALASHADAVVAGCSAREQVLVRAVFLRLITAERTRAVVPAGELHELASDPAEVDRVVDRLVHSRLLVGQGGTVELVHESLIHSWPLLRRWLEETQEDSAYLEQLRAAARQWQAKGHATAALWTGEAAAEARLWRARYRGELPALQRAYLDAVLALGARTSRRKRRAVIAVIAALSVLVVIAGVGLVAIRNAQQEATAQAARAEGQLARTRAAELAANDASARTAAANRQLAGANGDLRTAIDEAQQARTASEAARVEAEQARVEAEQARGKAERAKRRERGSRRAEALAAEQARAAAERASAASKQYRDLFEKEQQRVAELEEQQRASKIIDDVETASREPKRQK